ncbi:MAG: AmmeMemoRadiSam system protein B, partial [Gammaproteobacteria bacterium]|nr:AmmeMemoRadiSam system protein B [Gammaproteobacteria bacterium]
MQTKPAEVAGMFYPAEVRVLKQIIADCLSKANTDNTTLPKVIIAPHAGYIYSGEIAANAYSILKTHADSIKRVVLLGPAHRMAFRGIAVHPADDFATPLGQVTLDTEFIKHLAVLPDVELLKRPFHNEHCLEVQLPFLQTLLTDFKIIPVIVGDSSPENVARLLNKVWGDASTLIVISTDMSHYHPYNDANKIDKATAQAIVDLNLDLVQPDKACGSRPLKGLLKVAKHRQMQCNLLDLRNSGDTQGDKSRVVGYAAYHVFENKNILALTNLAKQSIEYGLKHRKALSFKQVDIKGDLEKPGACFVTLEINGQLRGCIGSLIATRSLGEDI